MIDWTPELEDRIVNLLINNSLRTVCAQNPDLPCRESIRLRMVDSDSFWAKCARARKAQAVQMLEDAGDTAKSCTEENAQSAKVKISWAQWNASKLIKDYADKTDLNVTGSLDLAGRLSAARERKK